MNSLTSLEARARSGDVGAFGELIRQWDHDLRGVAWAVVRTAVDTDDIMQATYEKAFRSIATFRGESTLKTWMHSICYRTAIDHVRYERRREHESDDLLASGLAPDSTSTDAINRREIAAALTYLDTETSALLMLVAGLGYSFEEASNIAGIPRGTVASRVARARKSLRQTSWSSDGFMHPGSDPRPPGKGTLSE
jgi:RNA polymerase sigma-70 factor (ECF subfamily)